MANVIDILVSKQAQKELDKIIENLKKAHDEIDRINQTGLNINGNTAPRNPADLNNLIRQNEELARKYRELEERLARLNTQRQTSRQRTSEEIVNQRALAQASDRQARATSALVGAMANLNAQHQIARQRLQNLIASQTASNREIRQAQREFDALDRRVVSANNAVRQFNYNVGNYPRQAISGIRNLIGAFGIVGGVSLFATIAQDIFKTTKELQSLDNALKQVSGTQEAYSRNQEFLKKTSEDFGIEIKGLTQQFTQFYVSAKDKLAQSEIEGIFTSISKAGSVMGLSIDAQNRAFNALNQMMSKGVVSSEELKGQLSEALPGAFQAMVKAVQVLNPNLEVTEKMMLNMMKNGELLSQKYLPEFAKQFEKTLGIENLDRVETLNASTQRLSNTWTDFVRNLNDSETGGISVFFKTIIDGLNDMFKTLIDINNFYSKDGKFIFENWKKGIDNLVPENTKESLVFLNKELEKTNKIAEGQEKIINNLKKQIEAEKETFGYKYLANKGKAVDLEKELIEATKKYNASLSAKEYLENSMNEKSAERLRLESEFITAFTLRNKQVSQSVALDYAKIKTDAQLKREIGLLTLVEDKNTEGKKEKLKAEEELFKAETNSKASFKENIKALEAQLNVTSKLNPVYGVLELQLRLLKDAYEALYGEQKKQESVQDPKFGTLEYYEKLRTTIQNQQKTIATTNPEWEHYQRLLEAVQIDIDILTGKQEKLNETFFDSQGYFKGFVDSFSADSGFSEIFNVMDLLNQNFETVEEKAKVVGLAISEAFQQAFNTLSTMSDANYQQMYSNLERQRDVSILFAGESATAREEIDRQYEERRKRVQRQQAESQKRLAMFNIATNTAQAVMAVFAKTPPPAGIPLALLVGAIGAAQLAMTASQPIPQFYKGTQNAPEGLAWTDEKGAELHTDSKGNIKDYGSNKGARLKKLDKGDKIYTATQTKKMMDLYGFNQDFNNIMLTNGISTSNFNNNSLNLEPLNARLDRLTSVVANKSEVTIVNNESGTRYYERVNGQRRELVNSVLTMKSRTIK